MKTRVLITAGPTREYIDPVRYISNDSSGRMGCALAKAALELGCEVTLIAGPIAIEKPKGAHGIAVISAREMRTAVLKEARDADVIIMAAAVSDWRPAKCSKRKLKRTDGSSNDRTIELTPNPDILAELCAKRKPGQIIAGFALESNHLERNARDKLKRKACDWIVANGVQAIGSGASSAVLFSARGGKINLPPLPKEDLAMVILSHILS
jgi:phosphopantothenoylcysteine decarboxylase/phosphopantothenate--cysteine ligase